MQFPNASIKHIMCYVQGVLEEKQDEMLYRVYVTDSLKALTGSSVRYYDLITNSGNTKAQKTSEQIKKEIFDVFKKLEVNRIG